MKKLVFIPVVILTLSISAVCFAGTAGTTAFLNRTAGGEVIIPVTGSRVAVTPALKPSANVFIAWGVESTGGLAYTMGTQHTSGTFTYATSSTDTNLYRWENKSATGTSTQGSSADGLTFTVGSSKVPPSSPNASDGVVTWTGWTASK